MHQQNLGLAEQKLGTDHAETLTFRNGLANAYLQARRPKEAIRLHEQNLPLTEAQFGADAPVTLIARNNLAWAYWSAGRFAEAIPLQERTLQQREAQLGADHPHILASRKGQGRCLSQTAGRSESCREEASKQDELPLRLLRHLFYQARPFCARGGWLCAISHGFLYDTNGVLSTPSSPASPANLSLASSSTAVYQQAGSRTLPA